MVLRDGDNTGRGQRSAAHAGRPAPGLIRSAVKRRHNSKPLPHAALLRRSQSFARRTMAIQLAEPLRVDPRTEPEPYQMAAACPIRSCAKCESGIPFRASDAQWKHWQVLSRSDA